MNWHGPFKVTQHYRMPTIVYTRSPAPTPYSQSMYSPLPRYLLSATPSASAIASQASISAQPSAVMHTEHQHPREQMHPYDMHMMFLILVVIIGWIYLKLNPAKKIKNEPSYGSHNNILQQINPTAYNKLNLIRRSSSSSLVSDAETPV